MHEKFGMNKDFSSDKKVEEIFNPSRYKTYDDQKMKTKNATSKYLILLILFVLSNYFNPINDIIEIQDIPCFFVNQGISNVL